MTTSKSIMKGKSEDGMVLFSEILDCHKKDNIMNRVGIFCLATGRQRSLLNSVAHFRLLQECFYFQGVWYSVITRYSSMFRH